MAPSVPLRQGKKARKTKQGQHSQESGEVQAPASGCPEPGCPGCARLLAEAARKDALLVAMRRWVDSAPIRQWKAVEAAQPEGAEPSAAEP